MLGVALEEVNYVQPSHISTERLQYIVHDLKANLHTIKLAAKMSRQAVNEVKRDSYIGIVEQECELMFDMIASILDTDFAQPEPVELFTFILLLIQPFIQTGTIIHLIPFASFTHTIEKKTVSRILTELLTNAIKYSLSTDTITISVKEIDSNLSIQITNPAPYLTEQNKKSMFKKGNKTIGRSDSTGLGLYNCKREVERMKGNLTFDYMDESAMFTISLA